MNKTWTKLVLLSLPLGFVVCGVQASQVDLSRSEARSVETAWSEQNEPGLEFNLKGYLIYAAYKNPALRASFYEWKRALERVSAENALPNPQISFSYFLEQVETRVGPQRFKLALKQTIPWFGTLGSGAEASFNRARAAYENFQAEKLKVFYKVKVAYYSYYLLGRQIQATRDNLRLVKTWEEILTTRFEASLDAHPDLAKVQVELGLLENRLLSLEEMTKPLEAELRSVLGLPDTIYLPMPATIAVIPVDLDRNILLQEALKDNPDIRSQQRLLEASEAAIRLETKSVLPSFTLGIGYIGTGEAQNPTIRDSGKDPWEVSVGINVPLWFNKNTARREHAKAGLKQVEYSLQDTRNLLRAKLDRVVYEYRDARRKRELYDGGLLRIAEQSLSTAYISYESGKSDFLDLIDAQRRLLSFQLEYETATAVQAINLAEIEMLTGKEQI
jgi:cobalt-zinc-cadmium efflux system outer membrane protein